MKDLDLVKIFDSMKNNGISELIIKEGNKTYEVRRGGFKTSQVTQPQAGLPTAVNIPQQNTASQQAQPVQQETAATTPAPTESSNLHEIKSPLVGTFYAAPKPDAPAFVEVGSKVTKGQTICMVEAMKNFNEIEADVNGVIKEICITDGSMAEFGQVLFKIEQS